MPRIVSKLSERYAEAFRKIWRTNCPVRYRGAYGARNTGKSYFFYEETLNKMLIDPERNIVWFRNVADKLRDSCFAGIVNAINRMRLNWRFLAKTHDVEIEDKLTGSKILFEGCDKGTGVNSITASHGYITDFYFEEAFELNDEQKFRQIDGSLRSIHATYIAKNGNYIPCQFTFIMNPWQAEGCFWYSLFVKDYMPDDNETLKALETIGYRFYINKTKPLQKGVGLALLQTSYIINKWRDPNYDLAAREEKKEHFSNYCVEFMGMWGVTGEVCYEEFNNNLVIPRDLVQELEYSDYYIGIDTAYSNAEGKILTGNALEQARIHSAYTIILCGITRNDYKGIEKGTIVAIDEYYHSQEINGIKKTQPELYRDTINTLIEWFRKYQRCPTLFRGQTRVLVDRADSGALTSLDFMAKERGLYNVAFSGSSKISINTRIRFEKSLMAHKKMRFSADCTNLIREIKACRVPKGELRDKINDHAINAWEYGTIPLYSVARERKNFKIY